MPHSNGEIQVSKISSGIPNNIQLTQWLILDAANPKSVRQVCSYDNICFKSQFGKYLISDLNFRVTASGPNISQITSWGLSKAHLPYMPKWTYLRPFISNNYLTPGFERISGNIQVGQFKLKSRGDETKKLGLMTTDQQELYLLEDLLYVLMSINGNYIKRVQLSIDDNNF